MPLAFDGNTRQRIVTVFGGTGYIGGEVVRQAQQHGFDVRVVTRSGKCCVSNTECIAMDLGRVVEREHESEDFEHCILDAVVRDATAVVNCISLWDAPQQDMQRLHVRGVTALAATCKHYDVPLVHLSGLGADDHSSDAYLRVRGQGDAAVYMASPHRNTVLRPGAIMGGTARGFVPVLVMLVKMRLFPLFGLGDTMLQPVTLHDLAKAVIVCCSRASTQDFVHTPIVDIVGSEVVSFRDLLFDVARHMGLRVLPVPLPYPIWSVVATVCASLCAAPPIAPAQVALMRSPIALRHAQAHMTSPRCAEEHHGRLWQRLWGKQHIPTMSVSSSSQQRSVPTAVTMQEALGITPEPIGKAFAEAFDIVAP